MTIPADGLLLALFTVLFLILALVLRRLAWWGLLAWRALWTGLPPALTQSWAWSRAEPLVQRAERRFPRLIAWIRRRSDPHRGAGLPLTLVVLAALYLAGLFGGLADEVMEAGELIRMDAAISGVINPYRTPSMIAVFLWITTLGDSAALIGVALVATGFLWADARPRLILPLWVTFLGAQFVTWAGKFALDRARPEFLTVAYEWSPSFPSGHTTGAMAVYGFIAYAIARDLPQPRHRFEVAYWTALLVFLVGASRVMLAVHHASDVAAGFLVGGFWLLTGFTLAEWQRQHR